LTLRQHLEQLAGHVGAASYAKELVMHNFVGLPADQLLERMVELSLRTEEHL
jgi:hypothetical protein